MTILHTGGCRCGAIIFEASADPFYTSYCHCTDCRRASGAPVAAFVGFLAEHVTFRGEASIYGKFPISRSFCATCGAPIAYRDARIEDQVFFMLGAMDHPERYPPTVHGYVSEQLPLDFCGCRSTLRRGRVMCCRMLGLLVADLQQPTGSLHF